MIKCKNCHRALYSDETKESHIGVCGGIDDDSAEAIENIEDHFKICCDRCGCEVPNEDYLNMTPNNELFCDDCTFETGGWI